MNAADIIKQYGRGVPAIVQSAKIVHVCEYMLSCHVPGTVILSEYGEVKGTLSQNDIITASGRLGSAVLQMVASDLVRDLVPACESTTQIVQVMELLNNTSSEFVLVTEDGEIKGMITLADVLDLLLQAVSEHDEPAADNMQEPATAAKAKPPVGTTPHAPAIAPARPVQDAIRTSA